MRRAMMLIPALLCSCLLFAGVWTFAPDDAWFPVPLADRNHPRFSLSFPYYFEQEIDTLQRGERGGLREFLEFGGVKSLLRYASESDTPMGAELSLGAGLITLFDSFADRLDNLGWEGSGFLTLNFRTGEHTVARFGFHHLSSHVGDEYLANYGVIGLPMEDDADLAKGATYGFYYVRDSLLLGISFRPSHLVHLYLEARYSMRMFTYMYCYNRFPWQVRMGLELFVPTGDEAIGTWYLALHADAFQESSWYPSSTIQAGFLVKAEGKAEQVRIGLEYQWGRVAIAAFNHVDDTGPDSWDEVRKERYFAIGAWYDFS